MAVKVGPPSKWTKPQQQKIDDALLAGESVTFYWAAGDKHTVEAKSA
jgi:hypothetical protein